MLRFLLCSTLSHICIKRKIAAVGYVANQEQTPRALEGIKGLMFLYPGGLAVATFVAMFFLYKLSDERYNQIVADLTARKNADTDKVGCL